MYSFARVSSSVNLFVDLFNFPKRVSSTISYKRSLVAEILFKEGYIKSFEIISDENQGIIRITLKYDEKGTRVIDGIKRIRLRIIRAKFDNR